MDDENISWFIQCLIKKYLQKISFIFFRNGPQSGLKNTFIIKSLILHFLLVLHCHVIMEGIELMEKLKFCLKHKKDWMVSWNFFMNSVIFAYKFAIKQNNWNIINFCSYSFRKVWRRQLAPSSRLGVLWVQLRWRSTRVWQSRRNNETFLHQNATT